jgi:spore coat protein U-like protein
MHARSKIFRTLTSLAILASVAVFPGRSSAATVTGTLAVTATVSTNCLFNTSTMAFGTYDPIVTNKTSPLRVTGDVNITCNPGTTATISLGTGLYSAFASGTTRALKDSASDYVSYDLYTSSAYTTVWNTTNTVNATGTGSAQSVSVYGDVPAAQGKPTGSYSDTVAVTVTF